MVNGLTIRRATADDADTLARVHIDSWLAAYRGLVPDSHLATLDYARREERFRKSLKENSEETYIAEQDGDIVGFLTIGRCRDDDIDPEETGEIWGIYLAPNHWRKGVGRSLCQYGESLLTARGFASATLWVLSGNAQARLFYEAMGFEADGAAKTLELGAPLEAVRYRKELKKV